MLLEDKEVKALLPFNYVTFEGDSLKESIG